MSAPLSSTTLSNMALVRHSLRHFWRTHVGVVLGVACATAVLVGALAVGDSVRLSLGEQARNRIGRVDSALVVRERYFHADLAERVKQDLGQALLATVLQFQGIVRNQARATRAGIVDVFGVDQRFFELSPRGNPRAAPAAGQALVNERLAAQLAVQPGDSILLRIEKPSMLPRDMLMATIDDISFALRLEVGEILGEDEFGRFGLRASQVPPFNLFVSLPWLQKQLDLAGRANVVIAGGVEEGTVDRANAALRKRWTLADAGLHVRDLEGTNLFELTSDRVFIDPPVAEAAGSLGPNVVGVLTYFVNAL
ncbi:MAG: ABC transporter permease, partial [Planctomycetota bacterium]